MVDFGKPLLVEEVVVDTTAVAVVEMTDVVQDLTVEAEVVEDHL
jgi:hypothetical protein